jgi:hypothetical protein
MGMIYTKSGAEAIAARYEVTSPGTGNRHWGTTFFGPRSSNKMQPGPQATMSELQPNEAITPHFHGVSMFQVFISGYGTIGNQGKVLDPVTIQFKDHHTAYGPITAGPLGLTFMAMRMYTGNSEPTYLDRPGYRDRMRPSKRRNLTSPAVKFSIEPVLKHREEVIWETLLQDESDKMHAQVVRLGGGMSVKGPDPKIASGYYVVVGNGSLVHGGQELPQWSMVCVEPTEDSFEIKAGSKGLEALVLQYPIEDRTHDAS